MLTEVAEEIVKKKKGESNCRWFRDSYFDLFIWHDDCDDYTNFQLYYDIYKTQRSLFWNRQTGFSHHFVDDGENRPGKSKATPIVFMNHDKSIIEIDREFKLRSTMIDEKVSKFVIQKMADYIKNTAIPDI